MPRCRPRPYLLLAACTGVLAPWPSWAGDGPHPEDVWRELGTQQRSIELGGYALHVEERVVESPELERWIPAIVPSPQAEAAAWLYRTLNGASVRYDDFLGSERVRFQRSLSFRLGTEQVVPSEVQGVIGQLYDRNHDGRLGRRELVKGNKAMERFFCARVRDGIEPDPGFQQLPPLATATAFADAWLAFESNQAWRVLWDCPDCAGIPHLDKQAALVKWMQEYSPPIDGAHAALLVPGLNQVFLTLDEHPDRGSTLRLEASDGRVYWDTGALAHAKTALDGRVDLVTSTTPFPGSSHNTVTERWERYAPGASNQWMFEVLVDMAHSHLPKRWQVAEAMNLDPEIEVPDWFHPQLEASLNFEDETEAFDFDDAWPETQPLAPPSFN